METQQTYSGRSAIARSNGQTTVAPQIIQNPYRVKDTPNTSGYYEMVWNEKIDGRTRQKHKSTGYRTRSEAQKFVDDWFLAEAMLPPELTTVEPIARTVNDVLDFYLLKFTGTDRLEAHIASVKSLRRLLGGYDARLIDDDAVARYQETRLTEPTRHGKSLMQQASVSGEVTKLQAALNYAMLKGYVTGLKVHPEKKIVIFEYQKQFPPKDFALSAEREREFYAHGMGASLPYYDVKGWYHASAEVNDLSLFIALGLDCAQRAGAIHELTWRRVNDGDMPVDWCWVDFRVPGRKETNKRRAKVRLEPRAVPLLQRARREAQDRIALLNASRPKGTPPVSLLDQPIIRATPAAMKLRFSRLVDRLAAADPYWSRMTPHTMRHTWATLAIEDGLPPTAVAAQLADNLATVIRVYCKVRHADIETLKRRRGMV